MTKTTWTPTLAWLGAVSAALALAFAAPSESNFMGRLPTISVKRLDQQRIVLPHGLRAERTLALVAFDRSHRPEIQSWIQGLRLDQDASIAWFKMPVLNDPGTEQGRKFVLVVDDGGVAKQKYVKLGQLDGGLRVITDGLAAGDKVIVKGLMRARSGQKVTVQDEPAPPPPRKGPDEAKAG